MVPNFFHLDEHVCHSYPGKPTGVVSQQIDTVVLVGGTRDKAESLSSLYDRGSMNHCNKVWGRVS